MKDCHHQFLNKNQIRLNIYNLISFYYYNEYDYYPTTVNMIITLLKKYKDKRQLTRLLK